MRNKLFGLLMLVPFVSSTVLSCGGTSGWEEDFVDYAKLREDAQDMQELLNKIPDKIATNYKSTLPSSIGQKGLIVTQEMLGIEVTIEHPTIKPEFQITQISNKKGKIWIRLRLHKKWIHREKRIEIYDYDRKIQIENPFVIAFIEELKTKKTSKTKSIPSEVSGRGKTTSDQLGLNHIEINENWHIEWTVLGYDDPKGCILLKISITVNGELEGHQQLSICGYRKMNVSSDDFE
ncbi:MULTISPECIES: lipoprotein 17-related variable surface protein [unclassified Mycoplasma]|uniref:lipoprotein 17-related variable surface protein n=1 Tax=unclassified Mycoplasma TaxID=2683645 RepID=UPI000FDEA83D